MPHARPSSSLVVGVVVSTLACGESPQRDPVTGLLPALGPYPSLVLDELSWLDAASLAQEVEARDRTRAVGFLAVPGRGTWCTATLVAPDAVLAAAWCARDEDDLDGAEVFFRREAGIPESEWAPFSCPEMRLRDVELGIVVLGCRGDPGATFGVVSLRGSPTIPETAVYLVEQACDHFHQAACRPDKRVADGFLRARRRGLRHDADAFEGALGGPLFEKASHELVGIHLGGAGDETLNAGTPSHAILGRLQDTLPHLELGRRRSTFGAPPPPPDPYEPNDDQGTATPIRVGFASSDAWIDDDDQDVYRLDLTEDQVVEVELRFEHRLGDVDATVFDGSLEGIKVASALSSTDDEILRFRAGRTGTFYLLIYGYDGATNTYALAVR